eukprot:234472-Pleurochrysis_carterae.AAC.1
MKRPCLHSPSLLVKKTATTTTATSASDTTKQSAVAYLAQKEGGGAGCGGGGGAVWDRRGCGPKMGEYGVEGVGRSKGGGETNSI